MPIKHIVLFKFKASATEQQQADCLRDIATLKDKIPGITSFHCGSYESPENFNQGFTHGFIMEFENAERRDAYLTHPIHMKLLNKFVPLIEDTPTINLTDNKYCVSFDFNF